ncbi:hypothetical protein MMPV_009786 [Pyropia vietnamensis]
MATLRHDAPSAMGGWLVKEGSFRRRYRRYVRLKGTILSNHHSEASPATWEVNVSDVGVSAGTRTGELVLTLPDRRVSFFADSPEEAAAWTRALTAVATRRIEDAYELGSRLGEGAFATVVRGVDRATREAVAVKVIKKDAFDDREMEFVVRETAIMKSINHPNIVAVRDVYESRSHLYLVLELLEGGELFDLVASAGSLSEQRASEVMRGVVNIKPENILATSKTWPLEVKLSDLGMAHSHLDDDGDRRPDSYYVDDDDASNPSSASRSSSRSQAQSASSAPLSTGNTPQFRMPSTAGQSAPAESGRGGEGGGGHLIGTPGYVAPEVIRRLPGANAPPSDMWSAGVVLYILLSGKMPFYGRNDAECLARTASGSYAMPAREWSRVSPAAVSLVRGMLCVDPTKRLTASAALQHPWLASPSTLSASPLENNLSGLHSSRRAFRRAVMACITMQRMQRAVAAGKAATLAALGGTDGGVRGSSVPPVLPRPRYPATEGLPVLGESLIAGGVSAFADRRRRSREEGHHVGEGPSIGSGGGSGGGGASGGGHSGGGGSGGGVAPVGDPSTPDVKRRRFSSDALTAAPAVATEEEPPPVPRKVAAAGAGDRTGAGADGAPAARLTFKDFLATQPDDITPDEAQRRYEAHCAAASTARLTPPASFFAAHAEEEWFREKYHPASLRDRAERIAADTRHRAATFSADFAVHGDAWVPHLDVGTDGLPSDGPDADAPNRAGNGVPPLGRRVLSTVAVGASAGGETRPGSKVEMAGDSLAGTAPPSSPVLQLRDDGRVTRRDTLFIRGIPPTLTRAALEKVLRTGPKGEHAFELVRLKLADPSPLRQLHRYAWAQFATVEMAAAAMEAVRGAELPVPPSAKADSATGTAGGGAATIFRLEPIFNVSKREPLTEMKPLPKSMSVPSRVAHDAAQAVAVMRRLDARRGVDSCPFTDDRLAALPTPARRVDYASAYLRAVHAYDYYSGNEFVDNPSTLPAPPKRRPLSTDEAEREEANGFGSWERRVDERATGMIERTSERVRNGGSDGAAERAARTEAWLKEHTKEEEGGRFRCTLPPFKLFKAPEFVHKHLRTKHGEALAKQLAAVDDKIFMQNYLADPHRIDANSVYEATAPSASAPPPHPLSASSSAAVASAVATGAGPSSVPPAASAPAPAPATPVVAASSAPFASMSPQVAAVAAALLHPQPPPPQPGPPPGMFGPQPSSGGGGGGPPGSAPPGYFGNPRPLGSLGFQPQGHPPPNHPLQGHPPSGHAPPMRMHPGGTPPPGGGIRSRCSSTRRTGLPNMVNMVNIRRRMVTLNTHHMPPLTTCSILNIRNILNTLGIRGICNTVRRGGFTWALGGPSMGGPPLGGSGMGPSGMGGPPPLGGGMPPPGYGPSMHNLSGPHRVPLGHGPPPQQLPHRPGMGMLGPPAPPSHLPLNHGPPPLGMGPPGVMGGRQHMGLGPPGVQMGGMPPQGVHMGPSPGMHPLASPAVGGNAGIGGGGIGGGGPGGGGGGGGDSGGGGGGGGGRGRGQRSGRGSRRRGQQAATGAAADVRAGGRGQGRRYRDLDAPDDPSLVRYDDI